MTDDEDEYVERAVARAKRHIDTTTKFYEQGKPLFTRATLEKLDKHFRNGSSSVSVEHLDGTSTVYKLDPQSFTWS
jgi:hypothetical protein